MAAKASQHGMQEIVQDADSWAGADGPLFGMILLKEVRHHFSEPSVVYQKLSKRLLPGGRLISITRPDDSSGYPFFKAAHASWTACNSVGLETHRDALKALGLEV